MDFDALHQAKDRLQEMLTGSVFKHTHVAYLLAGESLQKVLKLLHGHKIPCWVQVRQSNQQVKLYGTKQAIASQGVLLTQYLDALGPPSYEILSIVTPGLAWPQNGKVKRCRDFEKDKFCSRGKRCYFAHPKRDPQWRRSLQQLISSSRYVIPCLHIPVSVSVDVGACLFLSEYVCMSLRPCTCLCMLDGQYFEQVVRHCESFAHPCMSVLFLACIY